MEVGQTPIPRLCVYQPGMETHGYTAQHIEHTTQHSPPSLCCWGRGIRLPPAGPGRAVVFLSFSPHFPSVSTISGSITWRGLTPGNEFVTNQAISSPDIPTHFGTKSNLQECYDFRNGCVHIHLLLCKRGSRRTDSHAVTSQYSWFFAEVRPPFQQDTVVTTLFTILKDAHLIIYVFPLVFTLYKKSSNDVWLDMYKVISVI